MLGILKLKLLKDLVLKIVGHKSALKECYLRLDDGAKVADIGCFGFSQQKFSEDQLGRNFEHFGVDYNELEDVPPGFVFRRADLNSEDIPFESDEFDLVVCSHVIEHIVDPISFFQDCLRICKPGGLIYIEAPSERSILQKGVTKDFARMLATNFYDDPTHLGRPWTMQALFRLALYNGAAPVKVGLYRSLLIRMVAPLVKPLVWVLGFMTVYEFIVWYQCGWASYLIAEKPGSYDTTNKFNYYIKPTSN